MKAMVFAAGLGTRLRPLTDNLPKALVEVGGKPMLGHLLEKLRNAGYDDIVINVCHFADKIIDYVRSNDNFGVRISFFDERDRLLDTGGGILHARPLLEGCGRFLVHNVDIFSDLDLSTLDAQVEADSLATLAVSSRESSRAFLFDSGMRLRGWKNLRTSQTKSPYPDVAASGGDGCTPLAFSGIHIISEKIFPLLEEYSSDGIFSITDFYINSCSRQKIRGLRCDGSRFVDAGKPESLEKAAAITRCSQPCGIRLPARTEYVQRLSGTRKA